MGESGGGGNFIFCYVCNCDDFYCIQCDCVRAKCQDEVLGFKIRAHEEKQKRGDASFCDSKFRQKTEDPSLLAKYRIGFKGKT